MSDAPEDLMERVNKARHYYNMLKYRQRRRDEKHGVSHGTDALKHLAKVLTAPVVDIDRLIDMRVLREVIKEVLSTLTFREREVLKLHFGLDGGYTYTLEEIGKRYKVTRERCRQIILKAIRKLQHPVRSARFVGYSQYAGLTTYEALEEE